MRGEGGGGGKMEKCLFWEIQITIVLDMYM